MKNDQQLSEAVYPPCDGVKKPEHFQCSACERWGTLDEFNVDASHGGEICVECDAEDIPS